MTTTAATYDQFSNQYDRFVNWNNRLSFELPFLTGQLSQVKKPDSQPARVLDAACGTGMHAIALNQAGYDSSGCDISAGMVEKARENAIASGRKTIQFEQAGFGGIAKTFGDRAFDGLVCLGNSLPHVISRADLDAAVQDFRAALRPGGLLILQNRNFDQVMSQKMRWMEPQSHRDGDQEWLFLRFYDFLPDGLINFNILTLYRKKGEAWTQEQTTTTLYPMLQDELTEILRRAGFEGIQSYGGLDGSVFDPRTSGNLVLTAVSTSGA